MSAANAQLAIRQTPSLKKTERVLKVRPLAISADVAERLINELHTIASERVNSEMAERLRRAFRTDRAFAANIDPGAADEDQFVIRNLNNPNLVAMAQIPSYERYTFLAPASNVQFDGPDFEITDVPRDLEVALARVDGINGRFVDIHLQTKFKDFNEVRNWQLNKILIQGEDHAWVHAVHERFRTAVEPEYLRVRHFVYKYCLTIFWISFALLLFAEYRVAHWLYPTFNMQAPLSGIGVVVVFAVLVTTLLVFGNVVIPLFTYWFPYFEIEGNLSRSRTSSRTLVAGLITTVYTAAVINVIATVVGPAIGRWIH